MVKRRKTEPTSIDCLAYKDKVQAEIYEAIKDLSPAEQIEYIRRGVEEGPLGPLWRTLERRARAKAARLSA